MLIWRELDRINRATKPAKVTNLAIVGIGDVRLTGLRIDP
jgi:hypothetical protein